MEKNKNRKLKIKHNKAFGQNFLKDEEALEEIVDLIQISPQTNIFEIGCGSGQLSKVLLSRPLKKLLIAEIDERWITYMHENVKDVRMKILHQDISTFDLIGFDESSRWSIAANIPYNVTYAILMKVVAWKSVLDKVVLTIQEEVAQKLVKTNGRDYTTLSLLIQHHFDCQLHKKLPPSAFNPAPKVHSRIISLKPKEPLLIKNEENFWKFVKIIFHQPRRTIANNLINYKEWQTKLSQEILKKRAQQLSYQELVELWNEEIC